MRNFILLGCAILTLEHAAAEQLSPADREALMEKLEELQKVSDEKVSSRLSAALAAYRKGMSSEADAIELYLDCTKKVLYTEMSRKAEEFREWRRAESEPGKFLSEPGLRMALCYQLRWLTLTLEASSPNPDRAKLAAQAIDIVEAMFREPGKLAKQRGLLEEDVMSSVFARAYAVSELPLENWSKSPANIAEIFDKIILPPYRTPQRLTELQAGWNRRIKLELLKMESWPKVAGQAEATRFIREEIPILQWSMEVDLFTHGDENGAALRMLTHLEKYVYHSANKRWAEEFQSLLSGEKSEPTPVIKPTP